MLIKPTMKIIAFILLLFNLSSSTWMTDMDNAQKEAKGSGKLILLNFSGSDWCLPCMKMEKNVFEMEEFTTYASNSLVLVNADFPRLKQHQLSKEQVKKNEALADKYNPNGTFPYTVLLDANGKILHKWEGYTNLTATEFVNQVKVCL
jgi:thioredoxin-related protein